MKAKLLGPCETIQDVKSFSICIQNRIQTCGFLKRICVHLIMKATASHLKSVADPKYITYSLTCISYVKSSLITIT